MDAQKRLRIAEALKGLGPIPPRIFIALNHEPTQEFIKQFRTLAGFKIGLELISGGDGGPETVDFVHRLKGKVFYDGKFNDTPNTVGKSARVVALKKVEFFSVHASAGIEAMKAAVANKGNSKVLAVTILTSLDENDVQYIFGTPTQTKVLQFAQDALTAGVDGIICSPQELSFLKKREEFKDLIFVVPGIRPVWAPPQDQKRFMTPKKAAQAGADILIIGRPITDPPEEIGTPLDAYRKIFEEID
jgi:orotidine-5'-phosphate decarboxylase